ncbi:toxin [Streptomyces albogriseolus]|uniref:toxin n=1 Tax=Streptomyces albogriseolus TaxID=1887 RepID=UPI0036F17464
MKQLLTALSREAEKRIERPAEPRVVMEAFCAAMSARTGRPIRLLFQSFPDDTPVTVTGMRLDCGDSSLIVIEDRATPVQQLVILGHELWHEQQGHCGHHMGGLSAAGRTPTTEETPELLRRAIQQVVGSVEVPRGAFLTAAARADSADDHEADAETFGLRFGAEVRTWITGPYAMGSISTSTVEGRITSTLTNRGGRRL